MILANEDDAMCVDSINYRSKTKNVAMNFNMFLVRTAKPSNVKTREFVYVVTGVCM